MLNPLITPMTDLKFHLQQIGGFVPTDTSICQQYTVM